jgi:hypothetical protein
MLELQAAATDSGPRPYVDDAGTVLLPYMLRSFVVADAQVPVRITLSFSSHVSPSYP